MVPEDIGTSTTRFVAEPTIRLGPNDHAARASLLAPDTDPSDERLVLFAGKPTWKPNAQLFEELHGEAVEPPANPERFSWRRCERCRRIWQHWRTATHPHRQHPNRPTWPRSSQAYRAPGMQARIFVRRSPSKPNRGICGGYKSSQRRSLLRVPPRRVARRWRHVRHLIHFGLRGGISSGPA